MPKLGEMVITNKSNLDQNTQCPTVHLPSPANHHFRRKLNIFSGKPKFTKHAISIKTIECEYVWEYPSKGGS